MITKYLFTRRNYQPETNEFVQALQADSQILDDGGLLFNAELDFDDLHFNLKENRVLEGSGIIPLITLPATTLNTSFLLVLALKTPGGEFTSFGQSQLLYDPVFFEEHLYKVFTQRGKCQVIVEVNTHTGVAQSPLIGEPDSWSVLLAKKQGLYVSSQFGRMVLPTNFNIISCQP